MEHVAGLSDGHCHVAGVSQGLGDAMAAAMKGRFAAGFFCLMCTHGGDLAVAEELLDALGESRTVVPYFGVHPWYSHLFSLGTVSKSDHYAAVLEPAPTDALLDLLPDPVPLEDHLQRIREIILKYDKSHDFVYGIGEIGLDKLFRVPTSGWYGRPGFENARLSGCRVSLDHQKAVLSRQLLLAGELGVSVSVHCVKAHGALYELITGPTGAGISTVILHSYSGLVDQAQRWVKTYQKRSESVCFSFSNWINGTDAKHQLLVDLLGLLKDDQVLLETDLSIDRFLLGPAAKKQENQLERSSDLKNNYENAGPGLDQPESDSDVPEVDYLGHLRGIFEKICSIRGWDLDHGRNVLGHNHRSAVGARVG